MKFAIIGCNGSGKTTLCRKFGIPVIHALPHTRVWAWSSGGTFTRCLAEFIIGLERIIQSWKALVKKHVVLDRCFIDSLTYTKFFGKGYRVSEFCSWFMYKPKIIVLLIANPKQARPKKRISETSISKLNDLYCCELLKRNYEVIAHCRYALGEVLLWCSNQLNGKSKVREWWKQEVLPRLQDGDFRGH
jgi:hypothetical protein